MPFILAPQRLFVRFTVLVALAGTVVISAQPACGQEETGSSAAQSDVPPPPPPRPPQPAPPAVDSVDSVDSVDADEPSDPGYEVLLQGPVHEAFAAPMDTDLTDAARLYSQAPPDPINEQPPEDVPPGEGTVWIPGYWSWSDAASKYVWVSGFYRRVPPGRVWVTGYWSQQESGYRWTSGYWARAQASGDEERHFPVPPASIDNGPSSPPPGEDYFWLPGQWNYVDDDYQWRSGYWTRHYEDWVWQPDCYVDTPQGCVFVDGYWDRLPPLRGQLYAPVDFYSPVYIQPSYVYRPCYPLAHTASVLLHLFFRRGFPHFFYGDFYGPRYASLGYRPWYDFGFGLSAVSPWLRYYDWRYRQRGIDFVGSMRRYKNHFNANPSLRPPKSFKTNHHIGLTGKGSRSVTAVPGMKARTFDGFVRGDVGGQAVKRSSTAPAKMGRPSAGQPLGVRGSGSSGARGLGATSASPGKGRGSRGSIGSGALGSGAPRSGVLGSGALGSGALGSGALGSGAGTARSFGSPGSSSSRMRGNPRSQGSFPGISSGARASGMRSLDSRSSLSRSFGSRSSSLPGNSSSGRSSSSPVSPSLRSKSSIRSAPSLGPSSSLGRGSSLGHGSSLGRGSSHGPSSSLGRGSSLGHGSSLGRGSSLGHGSLRASPSKRVSPSLGRGLSRGGGSRVGRSSSFGGGASFGRGSPSSAMRGRGSSGASGRGGFGGGSGGKGRGKGRGK